MSNWKVELLRVSRGGKRIRREGVRIIQLAQVEESQALDLRGEKKNAMEKGGREHGQFRLEKGYCSVVEVVLEIESFDV